MIKTYYKLAKPGIIMGNGITAIGGFALASKGHIEWIPFVGMFFGLSLIIASGCVFNNYHDRIIDEKMTRTKNRALVTKEVSVKSALIYGSVLLALGSCILGFFTSLLSLSIALAGFVIYVFLYTPLKLRSIHGTLVGSIAGAVPPVVGYCATGHSFDLAALLLFLLIALWQMPHFFAIAMFRIHEYSAAAIPVLPAVRGTHATKIQMLLYTIAFLLTSVLPTIFGYTGYMYLSVAATLGLAWLILCIRGFTAANDKTWAHKMFRLSLIVIMALSLMISIDTV